jgi:hypothetical protein
MLGLVVVKSVVKVAPHWLVVNWLRVLELVVKLPVTGLNWLVVELQLVLLVMSVVNLRQVLLLVVLSVV